MIVVQPTSNLPSNSRSPFLLLPFSLVFSYHSHEDAVFLLGPGPAGFNVFVPAPSHLEPLVSSALTLTLGFSTSPRAEATQPDPRASTDLRDSTSCLPEDPRTRSSSSRGLIRRSFIFSTLSRLIFAFPRSCFVSLALL